MRKLKNGRQLWVCLLISFSIFFVPTSCSMIKIPKPEITEVPWDLSIGFERTAGEGPLGYKIGILSTGAMTFTTTYFYGDTKFRETPAKVTKEQLLQIINEFQKADFFSLNDFYVKGNECPTIWTDHPRTSIFIEMNGRKKQVLHNNGCRDKNGQPYPKELTDLENKIDEILNSKQWFPREIKESDKSEP